MRTHALIASAAFTLSVLAQPNWADSLLVRRQALQVALAAVDSARWGSAYDSVDFNGQLGRALVDVFSVPTISDAELDSLLRPENYGQRVRSADGRLRICSWDEKTGGTYHSNAQVIFFRKPDGIGSADYFGSDEDPLCFGAGYSEIHLLGSTDTSTLYVCIGFVVGCSTCCSDVINVIELTPSGINYNYPAFPGPEGGEDGEEVGETTSCMSIDMRCGSGLAFAYDPARKTFTYAYMTDDITGLQEGEQPTKVSGTFRFNGTYFVDE